MPLPLLGLLAGISGLAGGSRSLLDMYGDWRSQRQAGRLRPDLERLMGAAPVARAASGDVSLMSADQENANWDRPQGTPGSGLLADPSDPGRQAAFAGGLMALPGQEKTGADMLKQFLNTSQIERGAMSREVYGQDAQDARAQFTAQRLGVQNQAAAAQWATEENRREREFQNNVQKFGAEHAYKIMQDDRQAGFERQRIALETANQENNKLGRQFGKPPEGARLVPGPDGNPVVVYNPGSAQHIAAGKQLDDMALLTNNIHQMMGYLQESGTSATGPAAGKAAVLYGQILTALGQMEKLGTMQRSDVELIQSQLTNPSDWSAKGNALPRIRAQYQELSRLVTNSRNAVASQYGPWGVVGSVKPVDQARMGTAGRAPVPRALPKHLTFENPDLNTSDLSADEEARQWDNSGGAGSRAYGGAR